MSVKLLYIDKDYASKIEEYARYSTNTISGEDNNSFVKRIVKRNHLSIGRHCLATFSISCSLVASHQICRHPFLSIIQKSLRYTEFNEHFILPKEIIDNEKAKNYCDSVLNNNRKLYNTLLNLGISRESARYILPTACETRLVATSNFQGFVDICSVRCDKHAQLETRTIFQKIFNILCEEAPAYFNYFRREDGNCKKKGWL